MPKGAPGVPRPRPVLFPAELRVRMTREQRTQLGRIAKSERLKAAALVRRVVRDYCERADARLRAISATDGNGGVAPAL